jgi:hypothetical protein
MRIIAASTAWRIKASAFRNLVFTGPSGWPVRSAISLLRQALEVSALEHVALIGWQLG